MYLELVLLCKYKENTWNNKSQKFWIFKTSTYIFLNFLMIVSVHNLSKKKFLKSLVTIKNSFFFAIMWKILEKLHLNNFKILRHLFMFSFYFLIHAYRYFFLYYRKKHKKFIYSTNCFFFASMWKIFDIINYKNFENPKQPVFS